MNKAVVPYLIFEEKDLTILRGACAIAKDNAQLPEVQQGFVDMFDRLTAKLMEIYEARQFALKKRQKLSGHKVC